MSRPSWMRAFLAGAAGLALPWLGCTDTLSPDEPFSLEFEELPSPSIVSGDTLRDLEGNAVPLRAIVYNFRGEPLEETDVSFVLIDTTGAITLDPATGHVVATGSRRGTVRVVASAGNLQSAPLAFQIVPPPSAVARSGTIDTLRYSFSNPSLNTSVPLEVKVTWDSASAGVPAYVVQFRLEETSDTVVARLVDDASRRSPIDPSGASSIDTTESTGTRAGIAGRRIRLTPNASLATPVDSIVVFADVRRHGEHISGSPVRLVLPVKPRTLTNP
jgi:hypothetical protein